MTARWRPISSAPPSIRDGRRLLLGWRKEKRFACGYWKDGQSVRTDRAYWSHDQEHLMGGATAARRNPPTDYMEIDPPGGKP